MDKRRVLLGLITGALLGVFCIIGASVRSGGEVTTTYLFSFWFNRVVMGLFFGFLPILDSPYKRTLRGLIVGLFISFAFFSSTDFQDWLGFLAGGVYGIIIEWVLHRMIDKKQIQSTTNEI